MQKFSKILILLFSLFIYSNVDSQCNADAGIPIPNITNYEGGVNPLSDLIITNYAVNPSGATDYGFLITEGPGQNSNIVGFSENGSWDFENATIGQDYCFHNIAYFQSEIDIITNNPTMQSLLPTGCLTGGEGLEELIFCIQENFSLGSISDAVDSILTTIIPLVVPEFLSPNDPPCYNIAEGNEVYCITYEGTTIFTCTASAGNPVEPAVNNYVEGINNPNDLTVLNYINFPSGATDDGFVITAGSGNNASIVDFTVDGSWDFANAIDGQQYCFRSFAYNQNELNLITNNVDIQSIFNSGCLQGNETMSEFVACVLQQFPQAATINEVDIALSQAFPNVIPEFQPPNNPPCYNFADLSTEYCITYNLTIPSTCNADAGFPIAPDIDFYIEGENNPNELITNFYYPPSGTTNNGFVITTGSGFNASIVGFSDDGSWDFANAIQGESYCFTSFAYNQSELDSLTFNTDLQTIFTSGCMQGGETMAEFLECVLQQFPQSATINQVEVALSQTFSNFVPAFQPPNNPPCFAFVDLGFQYCITYDPLCIPLTICDDNNPNTDFSIYDADCNCVGLANQDPCNNPNAGEPEFPLDVFCSNNTTEDLIVTDFVTQPSGTTDYSYIITVDGGNIVGFSEDGSWNLNQSNYNYEPEQICIYPFAYNNSDLELLVSILGLLYDSYGYSDPYYDCFTNVQSWGEFVICLNESYYDYYGYNELEIDDFEDILSYLAIDLINDNLGGLANDFCYDLGTPHCISLCSSFDDDGDGILSEFEDINGNGNYDDDDTDEDDIPNYLDTDDDGDGILTIDEDINNDGNLLNDDTDLNGIPNYLDNDDDGDLVLTFLEDLNTNNNFDDDDTDGDQIPNYLDNDDDGDGILTIDEDTNGNLLPWDDDIDNDGIPDYLDDDVVGIEDNFLKFNILPNPNIGNFKIEIIESNFKVAIFNSVGELVYNNHNNTQVNLNDAVNGIYVIKITTENKIYQQNFVVRN